MVLRNLTVVGNGRGAQRIRTLMMLMMATGLLFCPSCHDIRTDACRQLRWLTADDISVLRASSIRLSVKIALTKRLLLCLHHLQALIGYVTMTLRLLLQHVADLEWILLRA